MLNEMKELKAQKMVPHRDFYNVRKVRNSIRLVIHTTQFRGNSLSRIIGSLSVGIT